MNIVLVAGEASGDSLGAGLIEAFRRRYPQASFAGIAGPNMLATGCQTAFPMERLSVMGLFEVAGRYLELLPARARLIRRWRREQPTAFVGIDAPDFNLEIEARLRRSGIPVMHYVSPSVWAWRKYRVHKIARAVDKMLCLFPFEPELYARYGVAAEFVGHPLGEQIPAMDAGERRQSSRRELGLPERAQVVALLPGSRTTEVARLSQLLAQTASWLRSRRPELQFLVPLANETCARVFEARAHLSHSTNNIRLLHGQSLAAMGAADVVLTASGTATLEAMLLGRPMVITYKTLELTWQVGKRLLNVDHVGLPNLLAGKRIVPEFLQDAATPENLGAAALLLLDRPDLYAEIECRFTALADGLRRNASERAAAALSELVERRVRR